MTSADITSVTGTESPDPVLVTASFSFPSRSKPDTVDTSALLPQETDPNSELIAAPMPASAPMRSGYKLATPLSPSDKDANLFKIDLPSGGFFYPPGIEVYARLVRGKQQAKFSRAAAERSTRLSVEAVTSCLEGFNAKDLTVEDFNYVMYWLRTLSYTKTQFSHVSICTNPEHLKQVAAKAVPAETLKTVHIITNTNLEERDFDPSTLDQLDLSLVREAGIELRSVLMSDMLEVSELYDTRNPAHADAIELIDSYAGYIHSVNGEVLSLQDRVAYVENLTPDVLGQIRAYAAAASNYGVRETINVRCKECGAEHAAEIAVSAHDFF